MKMRRMSHLENSENSCQGPNTIRGYYNSPEYNKKAFTEDGFTEPVMW
jgi:non-ribosomal peptide synthetase component E (peptide arylation enzyme)